jgi:hypothetical protein
MIESIHQSMINTWLRCGVQFERRYLLGEIIPPGVAARRGSAGHKGADLNAKNMIEHNMELLPLDSLQDAVRDEFVRLVKEEGVFIPPDQLSEKNTILNDNLNQAVTAIEKYHTDVAPTIKPVASELKITADVGFDLPIGGIIDLAEDRRLRDLKIRGKASNKDAAAVDIQPSFYYELYKAHFGFYPDEFIYDEIVPLKTKTNYNPISTTRDTASLARWRLYVEAFLRDLNVGIFRPADPGHFLCTPTWCGFYQTCPYKSRIAA